MPAFVPFSGQRFNGQTDLAAPLSSIDSTHCHSPSVSASTRRSEVHPDSSLSQVSMLAEEESPKRGISPSSVISCCTQAASAPRSEGCACQFVHCRPAPPEFCCQLPFPLTGCPFPFPPFTFCPLGRRRSLQSAMLCPGR